VKDYWTDYITVMWDSPESDGGSPVTSYIVEKRDVSRPTWLKSGTVDADCTQFKATNLFEGVDYSFRVFAVNKVGPSKQAAELDQPCKAKMPFGNFLYLVPLFSLFVYLVPYNTLRVSWLICGMSASDMSAVCGIPTLYIYVSAIYRA